MFAASSALRCVKSPHGCGVATSARVAPGMSHTRCDASGRNSPLIPAFANADPGGQCGRTRPLTPPVGVPDPIAIAKMCIAVMPLPTVALTVGNVTDATVLPACSGTEEK